MCCDSLCRTVLKDPHKYPPLTTNTKLKSCFSIYQSSEIIQHEKMILTPHLILQWLQYFWAQIPRELLRDEKQRIFGVWVANQSAPSAFSTVLVYDDLILLL